MRNANVEIYRQIVQEILNKGRLDLTDELIAPNYVYREPTLGEKRGRSAFREVVGGYRTAFPDMKLIIDEQFAEGDVVVTRWTGTGTHKGELMGIQPTGKRVNVQGISISRFQNGKLLEQFEIYDTLGMLRQMGVVPAIGRAAA